MDMNDESDTRSLEPMKLFDKYLTKLVASLSDLMKKIRRRDCQLKEAAENESS